MKRLSHRDWVNLCAILRELYAHTEFNSLPKMLATLQRKLVPRDISASNEIDAAFLASCGADFPILMGRQRTLRAFSERDRLIFDLLRPHIAQAWLNAKTLMLARQEQAQLAGAFQKARQGMVVLDATGRIQWMTEMARHWLRGYFDMAGAKSQKLPNSVRDWVERIARHKEAGFVEKPLVVSRKGRRLRIRWMPASPDESWLLFSEETDITEMDLLSRGLTRREAEVMRWLLEGKSNPEIGVILGVSQHTVRKHMEHILAKLGVESRIAAIKEIWECRNAAFYHDCLADNASRQTECMKRRPDVPS